MNNNNNNNITLSKNIHSNIIDLVKSLDKLKIEIPIINHLNNNNSINNMDKYILETIINFIDSEIVELNNKNKIIVDNNILLKSLYNTHSSNHNNSNSNNNNSNNNECEDCLELNQLVNEISIDLNVISCGCSSITRDLGSALVPLERVLGKVDGEDQSNQLLIKKELAQGNSILNSCGGSINYIIQLLYGTSRMVLSLENLLQWFDIQEDNTVQVSESESEMKPQSELEPESTSSSQAPVEISSNVPEEVGHIAESPPDEVVPMVALVEGLEATEISAPPKRTSRLASIISSRCFYYLVQAVQFAVFFHDQNK